MPHVTFQGSQCAQIIENLKKCGFGDTLRLLESCEQLPRASGDELLDLKACVISCIFAMAAGVSDAEHMRFSGRTGRIRYVMGINPDCYKLLVSSEPVTFSFGLLPHLGTFSLGHILGFSAIVPLTKEGYDAYRTNEEGHLSASDLTEAHIVQAGRSEHATTRLLLAGLYAFEAICGEKDLPRRTYGAVADHFRHFWHFLPHLQLVEDPGLGHRLECHEADELPKIVCPISGKGYGGPLVKRCGFEWDRVDKRNLTRWLLDLGDINERCLQPERRQKMVELVDAFLKLGPEPPRWL